MKENILSQGAFWIVNKELSRKVGLEAALLMSELVTRLDYLREDQLVDGEWFYHVQTQIEENTTLTPYQQRKAIAILLEAGFVETKEMGLPSKTYYRVFNNKLLSFLTTVSEKTSQHIYKEIKKEIIIGDKPIVKTEELPEEEQDLYKLRELRKQKKVGFSTHSPQFRSPPPPSREKQHWRVKEGADAGDLY